jgi:hypothetical protein
MYGCREENNLPIMNGGIKDIWLYQRLNLVPWRGVQKFTCLVDLQSMIEVHKSKREE